MSVAAAPGAAAPFAARLVGHWRALFLLAWPVVLSRAGILVMIIVDVVMVARYDIEALGALSIALAVFAPLLISGIGCMLGIVAIVARQHGRGEAGAAVGTLFRGLRWAIVIGAVVTLLISFGELALAAFGHRPELVETGGAVARWLAPGAFLQILFVALSFYLEGTERMLPGLIAMIAANIVNAVLNLALIGGSYAVLELGAEGAAIATTAARAVMLATLLLYVFTRPEVRRRLHRLGWRFGGLWGPGGWRAGAEMRRIGLAGGAAMAFETFAFATLNHVAGLIGPMALAAYTIAHNVEATIFMVALGISVAAAVRVGGFAGRGDMSEARFAGWSALAATMLLIALLGAVVVAFSGPVASVYSTDPDLVARSSALFILLAISLIFDGGQVVMSQCNRAFGDSWQTTIRFFIAFWLVMVPVGSVLGMATPLGEAGLFIGTALGCVLAALLFALRFASLAAGAKPG
ncbi:MAG: MATE family efflux transporter [Pseudomonadota bacterium]